MSDRISLRIIEGPTCDTNDEGWAHRAFRVELAYQGRTMRLPFRQGMAHTDPPTAADVLYCVLSDACGYAVGRAGDPTFEEWASEYVDLDTVTYREAQRMRRTYRAVARQTKQLRRLLGDSFDDLVFPDNLDDYETVAARATEEA